MCLQPLVMGKFYNSNVYVTICSHNMNPYSSKVYINIMYVIINWGDSEFQSLMNSFLVQNAKVSRTSTVFHCDGDYPFYLTIQHQISP